MSKQISITINDPSKPSTAIIGGVDVSRFVRGVEIRKFYNKSPSVVLHLLPDAASVDGNAEVLAVCDEPQAVGFDRIDLTALKSTLLDVAVQN